MGIYVANDMVSSDTRKVTLAMTVLTPLKFRANSLVSYTLYPWILSQIILHLACSNDTLYPRFDFTKVKSWGSYLSTFPPFYFFFSYDVIFARSISNCLRKKYLETQQGRFRSKLAVLGFRLDKSIRNLVYER